MIPRDWNSSHAPVVEAAMRARVSIEHDAATKTFDNTTGRTSYTGSPYIVSAPARIQAVRESAAREPSQTAGETIRVTGYLVALPLDVEGDGDLLVGDLVTVLDAGDSLLASSTVLRIVEIARGTERFERDLFCQINDATGGGA